MGETKDNAPPALSRLLDVLVSTPSSPFRAFGTFSFVCEHRRFDVVAFYCTEL